MLIRQLLLIAAGASYGLLSAAGVFTVLVAVGLIPRFAGKTHTAHYVLLYEEMVIFGTLAGCFATVFRNTVSGGAFAGAVSGENEAVDGNRGSGTGSLRIIFRDVYRMPGTGYRGDAGQYSYFARRISFRHGLGWAILGMAAGKLCGSLLYFATEFYRTVQ